MNYKVTKTVEECLSDDLDIIIVFGGINDPTTNMGQITDKASTKNNASFYSSVKATLEYLTINHPNAQIIYFTPLPALEQKGVVSQDENGFYTLDGSVDDYESKSSNTLLKVNAIKSLCDLYNVPVCDLYNNSGFNINDLQFRCKYIPDGVHANADGTDIYLNNGIYPYFDKIWEVAQ